MEVLTAFVRERSNLPGSNLVGIETEEIVTSTGPKAKVKQVTPNVTDIVAVLTVLQRRSHSFEHGEKERLNLAGANLFGIGLKNAHLRGVNLFGANLKGASLRGANLNNADLSGADLTLAKLFGANLSNVNLFGAILNNTNLNNTNLSDADLSSANLSGANLSGANLKSADLTGANLKSADLTGAKNLTSEQIKRAESWDKAIYDKEFRAKLGLPPEPIK